MTIISFGDKLKKPAEEPLVTGEQTPNVLIHQKDVEGGCPDTLHVQKGNPYGVVCVFFLGLLVLSSGVLGGLYCFQHWTRKPGFLHIQRLRGVLSAPSNNSDGWQLIFFDPARLIGRQKYSVDTQNGYLTEEIEAKSTYEKIDVPAFNGSNRGTFVHDFEANLTAIVDSKRCFVMPLNRHRVLPPVSLFDFLVKQTEGYYDVDTDFVRDTMRVVLPAVPNPEVFGKPIFGECFNKKTYKLERDTSRVQKRSAEKPTLFRAYAGKAMEVAIVNYQETLESEDDKLLS